MSKNKTVTAWAGPGVKVRITLPLEQIQETTAGHREIEEERHYTDLVTYATGTAL